MQQPTKDFLKDQLALAADEIIRLRESNVLIAEAWLQREASRVDPCLLPQMPPLPRPWWRRWFR
jgi:hypothetical protein